jgi:hypothetical protein
MPDGVCEVDVGVEECNNEHEDEEVVERKEAAE